MQVELDELLTSDSEPNRKNGTTSKIMKSPAGNFELKTPRDHAGSFEPQIVKQHQTQLTDERDRKILDLFALGNSDQDICAHIADIYGMMPV